MTRLLLFLSLNNKETAHKKNRLHLYAQNTVLTFNIFTLTILGPVLEKIDSFYDDLVFQILNKNKKSLVDAIFSHLSHLHF